MTQRGLPDKLVLVMIVALVCALVLVSLAGNSRSGNRSDAVTSRHTIALWGFSVWEEVMTEEVFPAFQDYWQGQTGEEVTFQSVFASSEQLTEEILDGAAADVAILSNEQHATWLRINNCVDTDWRSFPQQGISSRSPLVIVVRPGNPLGIEDWADLARPGVRLIHPDPRSSGGAQWALLAEYGSALLREGQVDREAAYDQLEGIWSNVITAPVSSREALRQFVFGAGDALVTYEQDALLAQARAATLQVVMPQSTVVSEHIVVIVDRNVDSWEREVVEAFVTFLWSETAQEAFTHYYFRAVTDETLNEAVPEFQEIEQPFTVHDLGDWGKAYPEIIHGIWEEQIFTGD
jgi:sulfate/thiosulfate-binding protein